MESLLAHEVLACLQFPQMLTEVGCKIIIKMGWLMSALKLPARQ
jgi:hypothetical protein